MNFLCSLWSTENVQWKMANWTWEECELVEEICNLWSSEDSPWKSANWKWNECKIIPILDCPKWGSSGVWWHHANWKWSQCETIPPEPPHPPTGSVELPFYSGVDATTLVQPWLNEPWNPYKAKSEDKQKRLIKLICKIKKLKYEEEKEIKDFKVTIRDVQMVVKAVSNIDLSLKLE